MARPHPALVAVARGQPLPMVTDPQELLRSAVEHRMTGLVWTRVADGDLQLDDLATEELERIELATWARHSKLWDGLNAVDRRLAELGVDYAVLKGVVAEHRWYDRVGERPCWDLDLLISPAEHVRIEQIVTHLQPDHPLAADSGHLFERGLIQGIGLLVDGTHVDLHFDLLKLGFKSRIAEQIWDRVMSYQTPFLAHPIRVLDPETSLLHHLIHLGRDRFARLLGYVDVARIINRENVNLDVVASLATREGIEAPVSVSFSAVSDTLTLPAAVLPSAAIRSRIWAYLWRSDIRLWGDLGRYRFGRRGAWGLPFMARGRIFEAFRWWLGKLFPPGVLLDQTHPGQSGPYLWRLVTGRVGFWRRRRQMASAIERRAD